MRSIPVIALVVVLGVVGTLTVKRVRATESAPPTKMSVEQATRLQRDLALLREASDAIAKVKESAKPYEKDLLDVMAASRIEPKSFFAGEVNVDFLTGDITRPTVAVK